MSESNTTERDREKLIADIILVTEFTLSMAKVDIGWPNPELDEEILDAALALQRFARDQEEMQ